MAERILWLLVGLLSCGPASVWAQTRPSPVVPPDRPDQAPPRPQPQPPPPDAPLASPAAAAKVAPFVVRSVTVTGSSLAPDELAAAWRPFVGQTMSAAGLVRITDALAAVYARHDIAIYTVSIPNQEFADGVVRVRVLEGRLEQVVVEGPDGGPRQRIEAVAAPLREEQPLRRRTLERAVSLIRDTPGAQTDVQLTAGSEPGGVVMRLVVQPRPVQGLVALSNRGTAFLGRTQAQGDLFLNSALVPGDQLRFTLTLPVEANRFQSYAAQYTAPLGTDGLSLGLSATHLRTRPKGTGLLGHATALGAQLSYPIERSYHRSVYLTAGLDGVDTDNAFLGTTFADDNTRAIRVAASFSQQAPTTVVYGSATVSHGLDALGAKRSTPGLTELDFTKLNARAGFSVALGKVAALRVNAAGQWTGDRLPGTELFALGGEEFGRGYEAAVVAGDKGATGSVELAYAPRGLPQALAGSEGYAYVDAGKVWYRGRLGFPETDARIASLGGGLRAQISGRALVQLEAARALKDPSPLLHRRGWRGVFLVRAAF